MGKRRKKRAVLDIQASAETRARNEAFQREMETRLDRELAEAAARRANAWALSDPGTPYGGEIVVRKEK